MRPLKPNTTLIVVVSFFFDHPKIPFLFLFILFIEIIYHLNALYLLSNL